MITSSKLGTHEYVTASTKVTREIWKNKRAAIAKSVEAHVWPKLGMYVWSKRSGRVPLSPTIPRVGRCQGEPLVARAVGEARSARYAGRR